jgi:hypothetical protein
MIGYMGKIIYIEPDHNNVYFDYGPALQDSYNQDVIVALIRDPECIFAYWELSGRVVSQTLRDKIKHHLRWILRVHNLSNKVFNDISLLSPRDFSNIQGNYYLSCLPDTEYQLEFGVFDNNDFISLVKSNIVKTPRRHKTHPGNIISYANRR